MKPMNLIMAGQRRVADGLWWLLARFFLRCPPARRALIRFSTRTPYWHLKGYMDRHWVFNPYNEDNIAKHPWLPASGRIHHILRADGDRHLHDHPWNARTLILDGWYKEVRFDAQGNEVPFTRRAGDTSRLNHGEYHRITEVSEGGVWTLFITFRKQGKWGFWVDGEKIPADTYFRLGYHKDMAA